MHGEEAWISVFPIGTGSGDPGQVVGIQSGCSQAELEISPGVI